MEILDPTKLAQQGSTYVLAVMLTIFVSFCAWLVKTNRADLQASSQSRVTTDDKFLTALKGLESTQRDTANQLAVQISNSATQLAKEIAVVKDAVTECRYAGQIEEASKSGTRLGRA